MNVKQMRERYERALRHAPNVQAHRDEFVDMANEAQQRLVLSEFWSFRRRLHVLRLKADVAITSYTGNPTTTIPAYVNGGVTLAGAIDRGFSFSLPSGWTTNDAELLEGQICEISGNTTATANGRWVIEKAWGTATSVWIILDPRFPSGVAAGADGTLTLKHARYRLPVDAANVDHIALRGTEDWPLYETPLSRESRMLLKEDDGPSTPVTYIVSPNYADAYELRKGNSYRHDFVQAPLEAPTVASLSSGGGGLLTPGEKYEYRYAWKVAGVVSGPSPTATVTIGAGHDRVGITALEVQGGATNPLGRDKIIYRRRIYSDHEGPWFAVLSTYSYDADVVDDGNFTWPAPTEATRERDYTFEGSQKWIRVWPTPDADLEGELHYYSRAPRLESPSDVPVLPPEMHMAIVHLIVHEQAAEADAPKISALHYDRLYDERDGVISNAKRNYLGHRGVRIQKKGVMMGGPDEFDVAIQPPTFTEL